MRAGARVSKANDAGAANGKEMHTFRHGNARMQKVILQAHFILRNVAGLTLFKKSPDIA